MEDAFVGYRVHDSLHLGKQFCGFGFVACENGFFNVLHGGAVFGTQRGVGRVDFDVLANAFTARRKAWVLFLGFG